MTLARDGLSLHQAMINILKAEKRPMTAKELASKVNYLKGDYSVIKPSQILARVKKYQHLFVKTGNLIYLK